MSRRQVVGFVIVLSLIGVALVLRFRGSSDDDQLVSLRRAAALQPCPPGLGADLPDVRLGCLGGGDAVRLRDRGTGRPTLVNIWGSWCRPCVAEVPTLIGFATKAAGRVDVVGIDTEDDPKLALTFAAQYGMRYPSLVDDDKLVLRRYGGGPPVTLLLDGSGRIRYAHRGQLHSLAEVEQLVAEHLGVRL